ncbi:substrate-binding periplasmic protein [Aromatoleum bremense]|uniref:Transporter substrate-binding domain-containing protein n=1 Tax=Aromatoleum bremense TaxID=76115 RepID=A0ABX1NW85_9RHOO|nr:transporter substrate-binding domain-containing protein [Aromatoleum bremense]NMG16284.1 transporter substrate-binding domain-containing protein [Aromatoleum bremense]QTQ33655.1 ABC transporter, substrate-binding protein [Aromatoleum bremense]
MRSERRRFLLAAGALLAGTMLPAHALAQLELQQADTLRIAVYADFAPYSARGKGIDIAVGQALAERLGLRAEIVQFAADEDMNDDLRNMVWRGHYLGTRPADVMMHVPVDAQFAARNDKVRIIAPYHRETMALARDAARVPLPAGSAANAFEVFTREKIGAELDTHASDFLLNVLNGRLRDNVVHFRSVADAAAAMTRGEVSAVLAPRGQLEAALQERGRFELDTLAIPEMRVSAWALGMAVKADSRELAAALASTIAELQSSGELGRIFAAHGVTYQSP